MKTTTDHPAAPAGDLYFPTDITPEQFFQALGRLRKEAADEIERLLTFLDALGDCDEDSAIDDDPCDGDPDAEPVLGSVVATDQTKWASGNQDDREGDGCADDREGDELDHGGEAVNEDDERGGDEEPALGWTVDGAIGGGAFFLDLEAGAGARPPQNRTRISPPSTEQLRAFRRQMDYYGKIRFDRAMGALAR